MSAATARPLPVNTILPVKGVSFRQEAVRHVVEGDELRIAHDTLNAHDPSACAVRTLTGEHLGFVPKELAARLAGPHPGGVWRARAEEVLRGDTWGLRVRLGPLVLEGVKGVAGADEPGLRHLGDGVTDSGGHVATLDPAEAAQPSDGATGEPAGAPAEAVSVYAKSGRLLGTLLAVEDRRVVVLTPGGGRTGYPASVVRIAQPA